MLEIGKKESDDRLNSVLKSIAINDCCTLVYTVSFLNGLEKKLTLIRKIIISEQLNFAVGNCW